MLQKTSEKNIIPNGWDYGGMKGGHQKFHQKILVTNQETCAQDFRGPGENTMVSKTVWT